MWPEKILTSLHLSAENSRIRAPHNREVEDGGPTYRRPLPFKSSWAHDLIDFYLKEKGPTILWDGLHSRTEVGRWILAA